MIIEKKRNGYVDFVKGVTIFLVVFGHALQYGSGSDYLASELYWDNPIMKAIYSMHMPLFAAISGYFYWFSIHSYGPIKSALKRIKQLLPVCIVWGIMLWGLRIAWGKNGSIKTLVRLCLTDFWFLWTLMIAAVLVSFAEYISPRKIQIRICIYGVILTAALFTPDFYWLGAHKSMFFFFVVGVCCGRYGYKWLLNSTSAVISLLVWCAMIPFYTRDSYIYLSGFTLLGKENCVQQILINVYRFTIGFVGSIALLYGLKLLYKKVYKSKINSFITLVQRFGTQTLSIYILSTYLFIYVLPNLTQTATLNYLLTLFESIVILLLCYSIGLMLQKSNVLGRLIIGRCLFSKNSIFFDIIKIFICSHLYSPYL